MLSVALPGQLNAYGGLSIFSKNLILVRLGLKFDGLGWKFADAALKIQDLGSKFEGLGWKLDLLGLNFEDLA